MTQRILVWKNKHSDVYYDASTPEALEKSARKIIKSLLDDYQYIYEPDEKPSQWALDRLDMDLVNMSDEDVEALPEKFKKAALDEKKQYRALYKEIENEKEEYARARRFADGEEWEELFRLRSRYTEDEWEKIKAKWPDRIIREDGMYRKASAWSYLQSRNGYEYENFSLEYVEGADE